MRIRRAVARDADALMALMGNCSAYQGRYARILEGYAITSQQIARDLIFLAERGGSVAGFYSLVLEPQAELDLMFVADEVQGSGLGRRLFDHLRGQAQSRGAAAIRIVSHPPSAGFYERMGAERIGVQPPSPDRVDWERPVLRLHLPQTSSLSGSPHGLERSVELSNQERPTRSSLPPSC